MHLHKIVIPAKAGINFIYIYELYVLNISKFINLTYLYKILSTKDANLHSK